MNAGTIMLSLAMLLGIVGCGGETTIEGDANTVDTEGSEADVDTTVEQINDRVERVSLADGSLYFFRLVTRPDVESGATQETAMTALVTVEVVFPSEGCVTGSGRAVVWPWGTTFGRDLQSLKIGDYSLVDGSFVEGGGGEINLPASQVMDPEESGCGVEGWTELNTIEYVDPPPYS